MKKIPKIGLDIDNCIANFDLGYLKRFGKFPEKDWCITRNVNNILIKEKAFWLGLPVLRRPNFVPTLYCSVRVNPHQWTKTYLKRNNLPNARLYQIKGGWGSSKYDVLKNKVDLFIDDSIGNFEDLNSKGLLCFLITSNYNKDYQTDLRINTLNIEEIMELYMKYYNK